MIHFPHGFAAVAAVTEALKIALHELLHVALMRLDVVNVGCFDSKSCSGTFPAPWLPDKLVGAAFLPAVARIRVQVVPGG